MTSKWTQLEIPGIPGVTESFRHGRSREAYGRVSPEREETMLKIIIGLDGDELYKIESFDQDPKVAGATPHVVLINGEQVGHVRHDQEDGPWTLARTVLSTFPPGETLKEQGGAHTAFNPSPGSLRKALDAYRDELVYREAEASAKLAGDPQ